MTTCAGIRRMVALCGKAPGKTRWVRRCGAIVCAVVVPSIPPLSATLYQGLFMSAQSAKVQAIAAAGRYFASRVAVANFSLQRAFRDMQGPPLQRTGTA